MDSIADDAVVLTNDDAALCKYLAVSKGYYQDPYLGLFLSSKVKNSGFKKAPEINRGYFARSFSIAYLVEQFILANPSCQILSLGAGYDSLFWRLKSYNFLRKEECSPTTPPPPNQTQVKYVEVDMSVVTVHKIMSIRRNRELSNLLSSITYKGEGLHSEQYHLISFDLRQVDKTSLKQKLFIDCQLDPSKPTLCITECVLVYMPNQDSNSLINWLSSNITNLTMLNYEQCNMEDRFGDIMLAHMNERHCDLMGVDACKSLESQIKRYSSNGLMHSEGWTLADIYSNYLLPGEVERIEKLEYLDEKELLEQLLQHYCIVIASNHPINWLTKGEQYWLAKTV